MGTFTGWTAEEGEGVESRMTPRFLALLTGWTVMPSLRKERKKRHKTRGKEDGLSFVERSRGEARWIDGYNIWSLEEGNGSGLEKWIWERSVCWYMKPPLWMSLPRENEEWREKCVGHEPQQPQYLRVWKKENLPKGLWEGHREVGGKAGEWGDDDDCGGGGGSLGSNSYYDVKVVVVVINDDDGDSPDNSQKLFPRSQVSY